MSVQQNKCAFLHFLYCNETSAAGKIHQQIIQDLLQASKMSRFNILTFVCFFWGGGQSNNGEQNHHRLIHN